MPELRAYALAVAEVRAVPGARDALAGTVRRLVAQAFPPPGRRAVRDMIGPLYRRVPGSRVVRDDEPTPADLDALLAGGPVDPARAAATWRLVEAAVAGLAWSSVRVPDAEVPPGLLAPLGLPVPPLPALTTGWCPVAGAGALTGLRGWLADAGTWDAAAARAGRPAPDVVVLQG